MTKLFNATNTLESILGLMREVTSWLQAQGPSSRSVFISELVLEEVLTNIVKYAYADDDAHPIEARFEVDQEWIHLEIRDDGQAFDPLAAPSPTLGQPVATQRIGGRGLHLVKVFTVEQNYRRDDGWNVLTVRFPLHAA